MGALTSADVTVTVASRNREIAGGGAGKNITLATIAFGDGAKTYPTGGVPLPDKSQFGYLKEIAAGFIEGPPANGFVYKFDQANHKVKIFTQGFTTGSTGAAVNENGALVENSAAAEGTPRIPNTAADTTYDMGALIELPAAIAPAAVSFTMLLVGE